MKTPDKKPSETPSISQEKVDALLEKLPAAYAAWEKGVVSPEMSRIQNRVMEILKTSPRNQCQE